MTRQEHLHFQATLGHLKGTPSDQVEIDSFFSKVITTHLTTTSVEVLTSIKEKKFCDTYLS